MPKTTDAETWYARGLRFACTQCGNCCTGPPGHVFVTPAEIERIAAFLGRADGRLGAAEVRRVGRRLSLTERANGDCIFLREEDGRRLCAIYPVRPLQCRTWPFWDANLDSAESWRVAARTCPGIDRGPRYTFVQIERRRTAMKWEDAES